MAENKRFEAWEDVDCNECSRYWDSSCDGVSKGYKKGCNSYLATRSVVLPAKLKSIERRLWWLEFTQGVALTILGVWMLGTGLGWF